MSTPSNTLPLPSSLQPFLRHDPGNTFHLRMASLLHVPWSSCSRWNWDGISLLFQRTPNMVPTVWTSGSVLCGEYKTASIELHFQQPGKFPITSKRKFPYENNVSHHLELFPYVDTKCTILGTRGMLFQASLFLNSSNHKNTHTARQEPETDQRN